MTKDLSAEIGKLDYVSVKGLMVANDGVISFSGAGGASINVDRFKDTVFALQIVQNGNNYTLQKKTMLIPGSWVDVGTFSRATSLSGAWSGGELTVTASPQGATLKGIIDSVLGNGAVTYTNNLLNVPIRVMGMVGSGSLTDTGYTQDFSVVAGDAYDAGHDDGWDAISSPSVTFTDLGATTIGDVSGRASISNKTDGSTRRTSISLALSKTTYTPSPSVGAQNCVVVKTTGGTVVGRIDIGAGYDAGYVAGWNAARAKVTRSGDTIYRPKARTASDGSAARQTENEQAFIANYTASSHTNTRKTSAVGYYKIGTTGSSHDLDSSSSTSSYSMTFIPKADVTAGVYIYIRPSVSGSDSYTESSFSWTDK